MALGWVNYLSMVVGGLAVISSTIITCIVLKRNPKEKLNWLFSMSFLFIAIAYFFLPIGAFIFDETNPNLMVFLTKIYAFTLFLGVVFLALSSLAFNYGIQFILRWPIVTTGLIILGIVAGFLFGLTGSEEPWYSIRQAPTGGADTQTSTLFTIIFYPICLIVVISTISFFIRAFKQTEDKTTRKSLKLFIWGLCIHIGSLIPNILSNVLAEHWKNAQSLNGLEFIMAAIGISLMLTGFIVGPTPEVTEETFQVPVA